MASVKQSKSDALLTFIRLLQQECQDKAAIWKVEYDKAMNSQGSGRMLARDYSGKRSVLLDVVEKCDRFLQEVQ